MQRLFFISFMVFLFSFDLWASERELSCDTKLKKYPENEIIKRVTVQIPLAIREVDVCCSLPPIFTDVELGVYVGSFLFEVESSTNYEILNINASLSNGLGGPLHGRMINSVRIPKNIPVKSEITIMTPDFALTSNCVEVVPE